MVPPGMENLISAPLVKKLDKEEEQVSLGSAPLELGDVGLRDWVFQRPCYPCQDLIMFSKCQRLFRSPSMPCTVIRPILKRLERPQDKDVPVQSKRRKSVTPLEEQQPEEPVSFFLLGLGCHCSPGAVFGLKMVWDVLSWPHV